MTHVTVEFLAQQGLSPTAPRRFFERVEITTDCWLWKAYIMPNGYGNFGRGGKGTGSMLAHRASWILHFGAIPDGLHVHHDCPNGDNRRCVNPAHLWLGTQKENTQDMLNKGREAHNYGMFTGNKSYAAILTWECVREIRERFSTGDSVASLSRRFGVSYGATAGVVFNETWVDPEYIPFRQRGPSRRKLSINDVFEILRLLGTGLSQQAVADQFGVSQVRVSQISIHRSMSIKNR